MYQVYDHELYLPNNANYSHKPTFFPAYSLTLDTDTPSKPQPSNFFCPTRYWKTKQVPPPSRHVFNNNTYVDFSIDYKHITIPSYAIQMI